MCQCISVQMLPVFAIRNISRAQRECVLLPTQQSPYRFPTDFLLRFNFWGSEEDETLCCLDSGLVSDNRATEASPGCRGLRHKSPLKFLCHPACESLQRKRKSLHVCKDIIQSTHKTLFCRNTVTFVQTTESNSSLKSDWIHYWEEIFHLKQRGCIKLCLKTYWCTTEGDGARTTMYSNTSRKPFKITVCAFLCVHSIFPPELYLNKLSVC